MNVVLTDYVWQRMKAFVDLCPDEISGLGKVERVGDDFRITDIALFKQTVSAAHSDITAEALAQFQVELIKKGESLEDWSFWWHSHAKMDVFFSGRDTDTIDESTEFPYLVSLVTNHKHEFQARVDIHQPVRMFKTLGVEIEEPENEGVITECQAQIDEKVSRPQPSAYQPANNLARPYGDSLFGDEYSRRTAGFGAHLPIIQTVDDAPDVDSADELLEVLQQQGEAMLGTDSFALAIEVWERLVGDTEIELDYHETANRPREAKKARKELKKLKRIGKDYSLNIAYDS